MANVTLQLECGHNVVRVITSEMVRKGYSVKYYCRHCGWSELAFMEIPTFHVLCRDCVYGRWYTKYGSAMSAMGRHKKNTGHYCTMKQDNVLNPKHTRKTIAEEYAAIAHDQGATLFDYDNGEIPF